jgi:hypothetical protein
VSSVGGDLHNKNIKRAEPSKVGRVIQALDISVSLYLLTYS